MTFSFHPEAEAEFKKAIDYYEECEQGLGYDFSIEVFAGIQNIISYPTAWPVIEEDVRRCLVNRFPYGIIYRGALRGSGPYGGRFSTACCPNHVEKVTQ